MLLTTQMCLSGIAGITSHLGFFIKGEHHIQAPKIFRFYLILAGLAFLIEACDEGKSVKTAVLAATSLISCYGVALFGSMVTYRVFFHRLRKFHGPPLAKVSKFWNVVKASKSTNFRLMEDLHNRYGDFVRTGMEKRLWLLATYLAA